MEEVVAALEEDVGQLGEEGLQVRPDVLLVLLVDQVENDLTRPVGVGPLLHLNRVLNLVLSEVEEVLLALRVVKLDGVGNLLVEELVGILLSLDQLLVVVVQRISQFAVLALAAELVAESEQILRHAIVQVEKLGILAKRVHDHLGHAGVEVDLWDHFVLLDDVLQLTVREKDELFGRRVDLLRHVRLLSRVCSLRTGLALAEYLSQLINAFGLLNLAYNAVALLDQVADDLLEEAHARMLARVPEVVQVVLQLLSCAVVNANVDQFRLNAIWSVKID